MSELVADYDESEWTVTGPMCETLTYYRKVPGGWLYRYDNDFGESSIAFVPYYVERIADPLDIIAIHLSSIAISLEKLAESAAQHIP